MWWTIAAALAAPPSVEQPVPTLQKTALSSRRDAETRTRAVLALASKNTEEARWALAEVADAIAPESALGRVTTAALVQNADLEELAGGAWPSWVQGYVESRIDGLLPERCDDPGVRALPVAPDQLVRVCGDRLPVDAVVADLWTGRSEPDRRRAAAVLAGLLRTRPDDAAAALLESVRWARDTERPWVGREGLIADLALADAPRRDVATELVTWRIHLTLVGAQEIPPRLDRELRAALAPELQLYGEPTQTLDWLHLLAAAGGDPQPLLARLRLDGDHHWTGVVDADRALKGSPRDALPLLAHRSPIVRTRAALRMEETPGQSLLVIERAWRLSPGRAAPLRGPIAVPALERGEAASEAWSRRLVRWVRRDSRQRDDSALIATLCLLSEPTLSTALTHTARMQTADALLRVARHDPGPRATLLAQGMDAVLRGVPFELGTEPAPAESETGGGAWVRTAGDDRSLSER